MGCFLILISLLQKRIRLDFDESDEEMAELMADVHACSTAASGQPSEADDAQVRRHELVDSRARATSPVSEVPEGIMRVPPLP